MPRTDPANHVRMASFIVGPWRTTTRAKKRKKSGDGEEEEEEEEEANDPNPTSTFANPPPLAQQQQKQPLATPNDYDSAWEEEEKDIDDAEKPRTPPKTLSGRGYLAFFSSSTSSYPLRAVSGHFVDASSMSAIGVSGLEIDPAASEGLGADVPPADACSFAAGDRLMALALFVKSGGGVRGGRGRATNAAPPSAVVLAMASGGDAATIEAPAPDPKGQGARRLLTAVAKASSSAAVLSAPRGVRPPRVSFECGTLLAGGDAAAYLSGLGVGLPSGATDRGELIVNVGTFEAVGVFERKTAEDCGENGVGEKENKEKGETCSPGTAVKFSEPARLSPSDPGFDPDFDS